MNDQSTPKNDPDLFPPKIQEEETSATYEYTHEIQHNIVAMILADPKMTPLALKTIRPQYFDNPILQVLVTIMLRYIEKYHQLIPTDALLQEVADCLYRQPNKQLPEDECWKVVEEIIYLGMARDFDYVRDRVLDFAKYQACQKSARN